MNKKVKLLILTQKVDKNDPILGFFHRWIEEFAKYCEKITVICLQKGEYNLPENVKVLSLGKEEISQKLKVYKVKSKLLFIFNFYKYIWHERKNYDTIFVHMNQEYVLLGGIFWKLFGKKIYMWRNHYSGSFITDIASAFCAKVFCTSKYSYTAKYKKTVLMPVGVDTDKFIKFKSSKVHKINNSILFLGRIASSKKVDIFVEALGLLKKQGIDFLADIYGDASPKDIPYFEKIKLRTQELGLKTILKFHDGVPNYQTPEIYNSHEIFVNLSSSGMYDKTIFEAMACERLTLTSNLNLKGNIDEVFLFKENDEEDIARQLVILLALSPEEKRKLSGTLRAFVLSHHNLSLLGDRMRKYLRKLDNNRYL